MQAGGHFQTQVYYVQTMDRFIAVGSNSCVTPTQSDWVVVQRVTADEVVIERYHGQPYFGVVRFLQFYPLTRSCQFVPRLGEASPD